MWSRYNTPRRINTKKSRAVHAGNENSNIASDRRSSTIVLYPASGLRGWCASAVYKAEIKLGLYNSMMATTPRHSYKMKLYHQAVHYRNETNALLQQSCLQLFYLPLLRVHSHSLLQTGPGILIPALVSCARWDHPWTLHLTSHLRMFLPIGAVWEITIRAISPCGGE